MGGDNWIMDVPSPPAIMAAFWYAVSQGASENIVARQAHPAAATADTAAYPGVATLSVSTAHPEAHLHIFELSLPNVEGQMIEGCEEKVLCSFRGVLPTRVSRKILGPQAVHVGIMKVTWASKSRFL